MVALCTHLNQSSRRAARRRGISLLEVMFSIGVAFVGLVGVTALLPLAAYRMGRGVSADTATAFGRSAVAEFDVRGMSRRDMWAVWNPDPNVNAFVPFVNDPSLWGWPVSFPTPLLGTGASFCLDPQYLARAVDDGNVPPSLFPAVPTAVTPLNQSEEPRMARITLRTTPNAPAAIGGSPNPLFTLPKITADEVFFLNDELLFTLPKDQTAFPVGAFTNNPAGQLEKRQYAGSMSWMATLSPILSAAGGPIQENLYTLSVVVFEGRRLDTDTTINANIDEEPIERVVNVPVFAGLGEGGGDVTLATRPGRPDTDLDDLRPGMWVMLGARLKDPASPTIPGAAVFRWYRIGAVDSEKVYDTSNTLHPTVNVWGRSVFLEGGDWNPSPLAAFPTQATIISGVVAVFEKTIRLENSSMWTP